MRLDQATGHAREMITARHVPPEYAADFSFEAPIANREAIELVLEQLIGRISEPLARRREGVLRLMCRLKYERALGDVDSVSHNGLLAFSLSLFRPSASPRYLCDLLRLRLEKLRLAGPVTSIHVEVTAVGPLELCQQPLFDAEVDARAAASAGGAGRSVEQSAGPQAVVEVALLPDAQPEYTCVDVPLAGNVSRASASRQRTVKRAKTRARKNLDHVGTVWPVVVCPRRAADCAIAAAGGDSGNRRHARLEHPASSAGPAAYMRLHMPGDRSGSRPAGGARRSDQGRQKARRHVCAPRLLPRRDEERLAVLDLSQPARRASGLCTAHLIRYL